MDDGDEKGGGVDAPLPPETPLLIVPRGGKGLLPSDPPLSSPGSDTCEAAAAEASMPEASKCIAAVVEVVLHAGRRGGNCETKAAVLTAVAGAVAASAPPMARLVEKSDPSHGWNSDTTLSFAIMINSSPSKSPVDILVAILPTPRPAPGLWLRVEKYRAGAAWDS